jgi:hypothetical protein
LSAPLPALVLLKMTWIYFITNHYTYIQSLRERVFTYCVLYGQKVGIICVFFTDHAWLFRFRRAGLWGCEDQKPSTVRLNPSLREWWPLTSRARSNQSQLIKSSWLFIFDALNAPIFLAHWLVESCYSREHHLL